MFLLKVLKVNTIEIWFIDLL